ncbi:hypothetical protein M426DRAFT_322301 [Hypoxylon sp. CI-4A]|nr:hypothetical protein M426DRAFT_322301 [Hypoxylon sp. CI-4A]
MVLVVVQHIGSPAGAKLALVDPDILAKYKKIDESRKRRLFELQCWAIRVGFGRASFFPRDAYRVYSSPDRFGHGRRTLDEVLADNVGVYQPSHSDSSSQASFDSSSSSSGSSDDDSLYPTSTHTSQVEVSSRRYTCDCKFPGLLPTYYDPQPSHRHIADSECWHGSSHTKHCVFADHTPNECVVSSSDELHRHCKVRTLEDDLNDISGRYCFAEADAIYEDAELARSESN